MNKKNWNKNLINAIRRMIEKLPTWREDAVIYQYANGDYDCDPLSTFKAVSREYDVNEVFRCHDLEDIYPEFGEDIDNDAEWLKDKILGYY